MSSTAYITCPLCEATCGLELTMEDGRVLKARGDDADVFSHGFICPKGASIGALHEDPDRLRTPMVRRAGELVPATWEEAFAEIDARLMPILAEHGRDAVAVYLGNPSAHNTEMLLYGRVALKALASKNLYSATSVDQLPKQISCALMFGGGLTIPIPDLDRTSHLLVLGANPLASNGSLMTAPDARGRLRAIRDRGGKIVVIDPRRSRTAEHADEHHFIRPGTDALLMAAMVNVLFAEGLVALGRLEEFVEGLDDVRALCDPFTPQAVAPVCGIAADEIVRLARELAAAESAAVYGRIGTCTQEFGTLASWLVDVLNVLTGNLDRPGGAMFPLAAAGQSNAVGEGGPGRAAAFGRWHSRVRGLPESFGELPVACLAEEIETPGEGQIRALVTIAGNPCVSTPNSDRLSAALKSLDFMVSLDVYVNETTRHADVILPSPSPLERSHYDLAFYQLSIRNVAKWADPAVPAPDGMQQDWETLLRLTAIYAGQGPEADIEALDDMIAGEVARRGGVEADPGLRGPERLIDAMLRSGPYDLCLADLKAAPHGIDLGPLTERVPQVLRTPTGRIELAPAPIAGDMPRLEAALARRVNGGMVLVGRRQLRSNNSWMHNLTPLVKGKDRCTAHVHPDDAARLGLLDGERARVTSRTGAIEVPVEVTDAVMPGVVSIPHGWGHDVDGVQMAVASAHAGANSNVLADERLVDALSGNAVLNGIPVELAPVPATAPVAVVA